MGTAANIVLLPSEKRILNLFAYHAHITPQHICDLFLAQSSLTYCYKQLANLYQRDFLTRHVVIVPHGKKRPSYFYAYSIGAHGFQYMRREGIAPARRFRPSEQHRLTSSHLLHSLAITSFFVKAQLLCRDTPGITITSVMHQRSFKQSPDRVVVPLPDNRVKEKIVIVDKWIAFSLKQQLIELQFPIALEIDRDTEGRYQFELMIRSRIYWARLPYYKRFGTDRLTIAIVIVCPSGRDPAKRLRFVKACTERVLKDYGCREHSREANLFRFTAVSLDLVAAWRLFFTPIWYKPFQTTPVALLPHPTQLTNEIVLPTLRAALW